MFFMRSQSPQLTTPGNRIAHEMLALIFIAGATLSFSGCGTYENSNIDNPVSSAQRSIPNASAHTEGGLPSNPVPAGVSVILVLPHENKGLIQSDLELAGASFSEVGYNAILFNVGSNSNPALIARAKSELAASKQVVIDSDGSPAGIEAVSKISAEISGLSIAVPAVLIKQSADGGMDVTPLETEEAFKKRTYADGNPSGTNNTAAYVLVAR